MVKLSAITVTMFGFATSAFAAPAGPFQGSATWTTEGSGACGWTSLDTDLVVGVSQEFFNTWLGYDGINPNTNPLCGRQIQATYKGQTVIATIVDGNPGTPLYKINLSSAAFDQLANRDLGTIQPVSWSVL